MNGPASQGIWETWAGFLLPPFLPPSLGSLMLLAVAHFKQLLVSCQGTFLQEVLLDHFSHMPFPNATEEALSWVMVVFSSHGYLAVATMMLQNKPSYLRGMPQQVFISYTVEAWLGCCQQQTH